MFINMGVLTHTYIYAYTWYVCTVRISSIYVYDPSSNLACDRRIYLLKSIGQSFWELSCVTNRIGIRTDTLYCSSLNEAVIIKIPFFAIIVFFRFRLYPTQKSHLSYAGMKFAVNGSNGNKDIWYENKP